MIQFSFYKAGLGGLWTVPTETQVDVPQYPTQLTIPATFLVHHQALSPAAQQPPSSLTFPACSLLPPSVVCTGNLDDVHLQ